METNNWRLGLNYLTNIVESIVVRIRCMRRALVQLDARAIEERGKSRCATAIG